ncbi:MAG: YerC/YecD family TrpR-related protein [Patescibacteria group bacterium]
MDWNKPEIKRLIDAVLVLKTPEEARRFLRDLLTSTEIEEFSKRFQTARMLSDKIPYSVIKNKTGLSSTTVARVAKWLNGKGGGYRSVISKLHDHPTPLARES